MMDTCFVCDIQFDQSYVNGPREWPGVIFEPTGNWGSTIYDPYPNDGPSLLQIRICDKCVLKKRSQIKEIGNNLPESLRDDVLTWYKNL
jgi:hypothetical protein